MKQLTRSRDMLKTVSLFALTFLTMFAFQDSFASSLKDVAGNVTDTLGAVASLITAVSYIAGLGFAIGAILKFKQHKDNPTQIPIGTPVALLFVAAALLFLPSIMETAGATLFGEGAQISGVGGVEDVGTVYGG